MIVRPKLNWFRMLFVWKGSVISAVMPQLIAVLAISSYATWTRGKIYHYQVELTVAPFTLLGVSLAIFLGFRNNASYERWWEGRKQWGTLLNLSRSLLRQALSLAGMAKSDPRLGEFLAILIAFPHALRHQLRATDPQTDVNRLLTQDLAFEVFDSRFRPATLLAMLGRWVSENYRQGAYGEITAAALDHNLNGLSEVLGACERLASTPLPYPYSVMIHRTLYLYCFLLPFGLVASLGYMTPVFSVLVAYTFIVLEALAEQIEEPFGTSPNDLPLEHICSYIERSLLDMAGKPLPDSVPVPNEYILL